MGPCLCLAIINLVPLIGTCSGFEVLSKSCDCGQQYTQSALDPPPYGKYPGGDSGNSGRGRTRGSGSSILVTVDQDTTDTVKLI